MFQHFTTTGRTDVVFIGQGAATEAPLNVLFKRPDGTEFEVEAFTFQILRRGVYREQPIVGDDKENKIQLIKAVRGLLRLGLRDAKEVAEYFMNNYSLDCGNNYGK
jgi:hypothetical protein